MKKTAPKKTDKIKKQIAKDLDLTGFAAGQQNKIISGLMGNVADAINIAILDRLLAEEKTEVERLLKTKGLKAVSNYLKLKVRDLPGLIEETSKKTIDEFRQIRNKK